LRQFQSLGRFFIAQDRIFSRAIHGNSEGLSSKPTKIARHFRMVGKANSQPLASGVSRSDDVTVLEG
jgi:hypothetical protein